MSKPQVETGKGFDSRNNPENLSDDQNVVLMAKPMWADWWF